MPKEAGFYARQPHCSAAHHGLMRARQPWLADRPASAAMPYASTAPCKTRTCCLDTCARLRYFWRAGAPQDAGLILHQRHPIAKTRQKLVNVKSIIVISATVLQNLSMKCLQSPEMWLSWHLLENSWNHIKWTFFWADFSHLEPLCNAA